MPEIEPPDGLDASGLQLWDAVVGPYVLTPSEISILEQACRTADELDRLQRAVRELPDLVVKGHAGQPRSHPLLSEIRNHRALLEKLCGSLALPNDDQQQTGLTPASRHAQRAARARWNKSRGAS
jgi:hypothetical protein